jgi:hypothetical protein
MNMKPPLGTQIRSGHLLTNGLVDYWLLNEGSGVIVRDVSSNKKTGTITGNGVSWVSGPFGNALYFAGSDDYIALGNAENIIGTNDFTISAWFNVTKDASHRVIYAKGATTAGILLYKTNTNGLACYADSGSLSMTVLTANWTDAVWHHLVAVRNGSVAYLYLDGLQAATDSDVSGCNIDDTTAWSIGGSSGGTANDYLGYIDSVVRWSRALSANEVRQLYMSPFSVFRSGQIDLWAAATSPAVTPSAGGIMTLNTGYWGGV